MDEDLEKLLIETARIDIQNYIESGYTVVGPINKHQFNEKKGLASVHVAFKRNVWDDSEKPLEKYLRYQLFDCDDKKSWHYKDSDGLLI